VLEAITSLKQDIQVLSQKTRSRCPRPGIGQLYDALQRQEFSESFITEFITRSNLGAADEWKLGKRSMKGRGNHDEPHPGQSRPGRQARDCLHRADRRGQTTTIANWRPRLAIKEEMRVSLITRIISASPPPKQAKILF